MPAMLPDMIPISEMLGMKFVPINFSTDGATQHVDIPRVLDLQVEGIVGAGEVLQLTGALHPANSTISIAKATTMTFTDFGFSWDNTGKSAAYASFEWSGP